jgi:predicted naringenin-chalcone synthase
VPAVLESNVRESLAPLLASCGVDVADVDLWAVHPGGRAILEKIQSGLELEPAQLNASRSVLRDYGNMSSATILFVLDKMLRDADEEGDKLVLAMAFGPGLTIENALLTQLRA